MIYNVNVNVIYIYIYFFLYLTSDAQDLHKFDGQSDNSGVSYAHVPENTSWAYKLFNYYIFVYIYI